MNDIELIWESYRKIYTERAETNFATVYHVSRKRFEKIHPWSHFTKSIDAAKDIVNTDKSEQKYVENSIYYVYEYRLKCANIMGMHDIHAGGTSQLFGGSTWEKDSVLNFINSDDKQIQEYIRNSILNEIKNHTSNTQMYDFISNAIRNDKSLLKKHDESPEWDHVTDSAEKALGYENLKTTEEKMDFYGDLMSAIETLKLLFSEERHKKWGIWLFDDQYPDSLDKFMFRTKLLENYYDGIVYNNQIEGGGDSYVIFNPDKCLELINVSEFKP